MTDRLRHDCLRLLSHLPYHPAGVTVPMLCAAVGWSATQSSEHRCRHALTVAAAEWGLLISQTRVERGSGVDGRAKLHYWIVDPRTRAKVSQLVEEVLYEEELA